MSYTVLVASFLNIFWTKSRFLFTSGPLSTKVGEELGGDSLNQRRKPECCVPIRCMPFFSRHCETGTVKVPISPRVKEEVDLPKGV